jgi:ABC-type Fe3+-hydroxamate transport system substrate-binding protein
MTRTRYLVIIGCATAASLGLIACGNSDKKAASNAASSSETATETAGSPESVLAPDTEVAAGLNALVKVADAIAAIPDGTASKKASDGLEPVWSKVEGTVKKNEPDSYATIEEDLTLLESGAQAKTKSGAAELSKTVDGYLAKHPG